ncbi:MAG TPA: hypothetical protein VLG71_00310 [Candidatus Limnocylindria bacterium]|nr:hypothetical protein [Candidatus Limnocylindria bacterium]
MVFLRTVVFVSLFFIVHTLQPGIGCSREAGATVHPQPQPAAVLSSQAPIAVAYAIYNPAGVQIGQVYTSAGNGAFEVHEGVQKAVQNASPEQLRAFAVGDVSTLSMHHQRHASRVQWAAMGRLATQGSAAGVSVASPTQGQDDRKDDGNAHDVSARSVGLSPRSGRATTNSAGSSTRGTVRVTLAIPRVRSHTPGGNSPRNHTVRIARTNQ